jgi:NAD+ kinase
MKIMAQRVAVYCRDVTEKTESGVYRLAKALYEKKMEMFLNVMGEGKEKLSGNKEFVFFNDQDSFPDDVKIIISVGGDGTFLETARRVNNLGIPVAGINTGRLGFLANIPDIDIKGSVGKLCNLEYEIIERYMLTLVSPQIVLDDEYNLALNEITVQKADQRMITIDVHVDGLHVNTYRADGLIISTATGSTAYNLSVGGPILTPTDNSVVISPLSPHNLTVRPIVVTGSSEITMEVSGRSSQCLFTCDSRFSYLPCGTIIKIRQAPHRLKTIMLNGDDFFSTLRNKFLWGADPRN